MTSRNERTRVQKYKQVLQFLIFIIILCAAFWGCDCCRGPKGDPGPKGEKGDPGNSPVIIVPDDIGAIQQAIDSLPDEGGTIYIRARIYTLSQGIHINRANVTVLGEQGTVIKLGDSVKQPVFLIGTDEETAVARIENIQINNIEIDGNKNNQNGSEVDPSRQWIRNNGIDVRMVNDLWVYNVDIHDAISGGIVVSWDSNRIYISNSSFHHNYYDGIALYDSKDIHVSNFFCFENGAAGLSLDNKLKDVLFDNGSIKNNGTVGIFARDSEDLNFHDLLISENWEDGCYLSHKTEDPSNTGVKRLFFDSCSFLDNGRWGLWLDSPKHSSPNNTVISCVFSGNSWGGIEVDPGGELNTQESSYEEYVSLSLKFLEELQDSQSSGLVPISEESTTFTTTYSNAMAAIAFTVEGKFERVRKIFNVFAVQPDPFPASGGEGGYQQFRDASDGSPDLNAHPNDFWIGDNAWLLVALKYYRYSTNDNQYDGLIQRLTDWFAYLESITPDPGIYAGFDKDGNLKEEKHPEGNIDVYGALKGLGADVVRISIKDWIDANVWIPNGGCFKRGPSNQDNLPTDHVSWGYMALGDQYKCILSFAEELTARTFDPYLIEKFDHLNWSLDKSDPSVEVLLNREQKGQGYNLAGTYSCPIDHWFRIYRTLDIDLIVTDEFQYFFFIKGDGNNARFEVKLNSKTGESYYTHFKMDFTDWRKVELCYHQFEDFTNPDSKPLSEIGMIEFAVNNDSGTPIINSTFRIGCIWYNDSYAASPFPVEGFAGFESEKSRIFVEGTGQMATAYKVAGQMGNWHHYINEMTNIFQPTINGQALGLPDFLKSGTNQPTPNAVASSWYIIAVRGLNPFENGE